MKSYPSPEPPNYMPSTYSHQEALSRHVLQVLDHMRNASYKRHVVVEFGIGFGSTPLLHGMCSTGAYLYSFETSKRWMNRFKHLETSWHKFIYTPTLANFEGFRLLRANDVSLSHVALILIDQGEGYTRPEYVKWLLECKEFKGIVVCHDLDRIHYKHFKWDDSVFEKFSKHILYDHFRPRTMVLIK